MCVGRYARSTRFLKLLNENIRVPVRPYFNLLQASGYVFTSIHSKCKRNYLVRTELPQYRFQREEPSVDDEKPKYIYSLP